MKREMPICSNQERTATQKAGYKNNPPNDSNLGLPGRERIKNYRLNLSLPNKPCEGGKDLLNQLALPITLMGDFNTFASQRLVFEEKK